MARQIPKGYSAFSTLSPQQQQLFSTLLQRIMGQMEPAQGLFNQGQGALSDILGGDTSKFEAPLMRQYNEQIVPGIAERFSGLGSGAQSSSAFQQALGSSAADLTERLGALRGGLQMQAIPQALQYSQQPYTQAQSLLGLNTQALMKRDMPFWKQLLLGLNEKGSEFATKAAMSSAFL